ncbi:hypothetical protein [Leptolyngbya sp. PCC 6406]|uniref:hypothetical protein n=1 Tax=Leptolyngbya sp. PCC 6406 TaxID=1173264 RepID=UPI0002ABE469|nr:hypothetical protein [Leptolyngbya sp. PCC 6406]
MASMQRISLMAGSAAIAAALVGVLPAQAEGMPAAMLSSINSSETDMEAVVHGADAEATLALEMPEVAETAEVAPIEAISTEIEPVEVVATEAEPIEAAAADEETATAIAALEISEPLVIDETVSTSAGSLLLADQQVAQVTRPLYEGVTPFYLGVGGNIGIVESGQSAVGDFGFSIISKVSFGPRFAIRPSFTISEKRTSLAVPITYNFSPLQVRGINVYPFLGAGVDVGFNGGTGFLVNGGVDIPISQQFTLNAQTNWRVSSDFGLGIILGVGYNFPFFFE